MKLSCKEIANALKKDLPGSKSHIKMLPKNRILSVPADQSLIKKSSVLLLLYEDQNELHACLIKRPTHMKHHAGQIALPGGKIEKGETALQTALRETEEEIGIKGEGLSILGSLSDLYVEVSGFLIHPFVGWLDKKPVFKINTNEVEKMVVFPLLKYKYSFDKTELSTISGPLNVPCIYFKDEIIWGATAMILSEFYDITNKL